MIEKLKSLFESIENNHLIAIFSGVMGALIGAIQRKLRFVEALASMFTGGICAAVLGPWLVHVLSNSDDPAVFSAVGFFIGLLIKEVADVIFKVLDEIEANPSFITDWIKAKMRRTRRK